MIEAVTIVQNIVLLVFTLTLKPPVIYFVGGSLLFIVVKIILKIISFNKFKRDFWINTPEDETYYQTSRNKFPSDKPYELSGVTEDNPEYIASRDYYKTHKIPKENSVKIDGLPF